MNEFIINGLSGAEGNAVSAGDGSPIQNKDLSIIHATDGILINRTKEKIDPFVEIQKRLLSSGTGTMANIYGVEIADPKAKTGWRNAGAVSERYLLIPNKVFYDLIIQLADRSGYDYEVSRLFWDDKRFAIVIDFKGLRASEDDGDGRPVLDRNAVLRQVLGHFCKPDGQTFRP